MRFLKKQAWTHARLHPINTIKPRKKTVNHPFNIFVWIVGLLNIGYLSHFKRNNIMCKQIAIRWLFCNKMNPVLLITADLLVKKWQGQEKREWQRYWRKWRKGKGKWRQGHHALIIFEGARVGGGGHHVTHCSHNSTYVLFIFSFLIETFPNALTIMKYLYSLLYRLCWSMGGDGQSNLIM